MVREGRRREGVAGSLRKARIDPCISEFDMGLIQPLSRSVRLNGFATCLRLEQIYWDILADMAKLNCCSVSALLSHVDREVHLRHGGVKNFSGLVRVVCVVHSRKEGSYAIMALSWPWIHRATVCAVLRLHRLHLMDIIPLFAAKPSVRGSNLIAETTPMPMYDYQCASCGHQLEAIQKISAAPLVDCPACQAPELRKMLSMPGFRLSGTGWYETDFKTGSKKNLAGGDKAD